MTALKPGTYEHALASLASEREDLVVLTAENRAPIRNLPEVLKERFIDVGICEQTMVGAAAGLALRGRTPVVHALATFLVMRAFEFIRTDVGIGRMKVKLVGTVPGFLSTANGPTHQAIEDVALMRGIPGMQVFCPADEAELVSALPAILDEPSPCYIRYNSSPREVDHTEPFAIGRAETLSQGKDVAILTYGFLVSHANQARAILEEQGISVRLVNLRMLKPVDEDAILSAASRCRLLVTVEDHFLTGGLRSIVAEVLLKSQRSARVLSLGLDERWFRPGLLDDVLEFEGFSAAGIASRVLENLTEVSGNA